jgi:antitoxin Phd
MNEISVSDARARLSDVVDSARVDHEPVYLTRRGRRIAAVIDAEDLRRLIEAAEDLADMEAARTAREEMAAGEATVAWDELRAELGLT